MNEKLINTPDLNFHSGAAILHFWMELVFSPTQVISAFHNDSPVGSSRLEINEINGDLLYSSFILVVLDPGS